MSRTPAKRRRQMSEWCGLKAGQAYSSSFRWAALLYADNKRKECLCKPFLWHISLIRRGEAKVSDIGGRKELSTFANTMYVNCRDIRLLVPVRDDWSGIKIRSREWDVKIQASQCWSAASSSEKPITLVLAWLRPRPQLQAEREVAQHWNLS